MFNGFINFEVNYIQYTVKEVFCCFYFAQAFEPIFARIMREDSMLARELA